MSSFESLETPAVADDSRRDGRTIWKSLDEYSASSTFRDYVERQNPGLLENLNDPIERRDILRLLGASVALAGFVGCTRQPEEKILPYAKNPEAMIPGVPLYFATAMPWASGSIALLVESHMGRPTKVEGNEMHTSSRGATDVYAQASVLGLYDPDRSTTVRKAGRIVNYDTFTADLGALLDSEHNRGGAGLRVLTTTAISPTLVAQLQELAVVFPKSRWIQYEPVHRDQARAGAIAAFGSDVAVRPDFSKAKVIVALEDDFLGNGPSSVRAVREFSAGRRARKAAQQISRLFTAEATMSITGANADHRVAIKPSELDALAASLAKKVGANFQGGPGGAVSAKAQAWIDAASRDLSAHKGESLVVAGTYASADVHALVHAINQALGNVGKTVEYSEPVEFVPADHVAGLKQLVDEMNAGSVDLLVMLGGNPLFDAPADFSFAAALAKVRTRVHLSLYDDETSEQCHWHVNEAHFLESWSDARSADGSVSIVQPLIAPLYGGKTAHDIVNALLGKPGVSAYETLRANWKKNLGDADFEKKWRRSLHDGWVPDTQAPVKSVALQALALKSTSAAAGGLELAIRTDGCAWDGRFANNPWLQECPRALTKLVWDNAAFVSLATATRLGLQNGDVIEISADKRSVDAPVWVTPGQADDCVTVTIGYGRTRAGSVGTGIGFDAYKLRTSNSPWSAAQIAIKKTSETYELISAQMHQSMEGRDMVRVLESGKLGEKREEEKLATVLEGYSYDGRAWAMVIDLSTCVGCNACVVACQAENNIPVVGKAQVKKNRQMHWIRIVRYFEGGFDDARVLFQPVNCMHCEQAPCELVCPVGATVHGPEGLNEMVYNRCVGTKYCSNNCPYKVRRFNFLLYQDFVTESLKLQRNPDVSVRSRGVMEKCSYCVQRISQVRIQAAKENNRPIQDGEIVTACQSVCPAEAITFGDKNDPKSKVAALREEPHHYALLEELNTRPRTTYLAKVANRVAELKD